MLRDVPGKVTTPNHNPFISHTPLHSSRNALVSARDLAARAKWVRRTPLGQRRRGVARCGIEPGRSPLPVLAAFTVFPAIVKIWRLQSGVCLWGGGGISVVGDSEPSVSLLTIALLGGGLAPYVRPVLSSRLSPPPPRSLEMSPPKSCCSLLGPSAGHTDRSAVEQGTISSNISPRGPRISEANRYF